MEEEVTPRIKQNLVEIPSSLSPESPLKSDKKITVIISTIVIASLLVLILLSRASQIRNQSKLISPTLTEKPMPDVTNTPEDLLIYSNNEYNYSFRYPKNFSVKESPPTNCVDSSGLPITGCHEIKSANSEIHITRISNGDGNGIPTSFTMLVTALPPNYVQKSLDDTCVDESGYNVSKINNYDIGSMYELYKKVSKGESKKTDMYDWLIVSDYKHKTGENNEKLICYNPDLVVMDRLVNVYSIYSTIAYEDIPTIENILLSISFFPTVQDSYPPLSTTGWQKYSDKNNGINFLYSPDWKIEEHKSNIVSMVIVGKNQGKETEFHDGAVFYVKTPKKIDQGLDDWLETNYKKTMNSYPFHYSDTYHISDKIFNGIAYKRVYFCSLGCSTFYFTIQNGLLWEIIAYGTGPDKEFYNRIIAQMLNSFTFANN